jgi:hypothetical protein
MTRESTRIDIAAKHSLAEIAEEVARTGIPQVIVRGDEEIAVVSPAKPRRRKGTPRTEPSGSPWLKELYDLFAPARAEAAKYSEEEINTAIDEAVKAVREEYAARRL